MTPPLLRGPSLRESKPIESRAPGRLVPVIAVLLALGCASEPVAEPTPEPVPSNPAIEVVDRLHAASLEVMKEGPELGYRGRYARLDEVARQCFDIPFMARVSLGDGWKELDDAQKKRWLEKYERFHISAVADFRVAYSGQTWRILGSKPEPNGWMRVNAILDYPGRDVDLYTDYLLRERPDGWRIVDVRQPPTVSDLAMRRSEYATVLKERGFDELIAVMDRRIADREYED